MVVALADLKLNYTMMSLGIFDVPGLDSDFATEGFRLVPYGRVTQCVPAIRLICSAARYSANFALGALRARSPLDVERDRLAGIPSAR